MGGDGQQAARGKGQKVGDQSSPPQTRNPPGKQRCPRAIRARELHLSVLPAGTTSGTKASRAERRAGPGRGPGWPWKERRMRLVSQAPASHPIPPHLLPPTWIKPWPWHRCLWQHLPRASGGTACLGRIREGQVRPLGSSHPAPPSGPRPASFAAAPPSCCCGSCIPLPPPATFPQWKHLSLWLVWGCEFHLPPPHPTPERIGLASGRAQQGELHRPELPQRPLGPRRERGRWALPFSACTCHCCTVLQEQTLDGLSKQLHGSGDLSGGGEKWEGGLS